ncbi:MAG TPA: DUF4386 domain-containing protein [Pyrinomonadaceae bacterium]|nr:DUF4386 domain-containing protein [Pyrinomonadaceae bacterium]
MIRRKGSSPQFRARMAGVFYLLTIATAMFAISVLGRLVADNDAATTATNILAHESLFRLGFAGFLIGTSCYVAVTALLYELLAPVNRSVTLLAAFFSLVGCTLWILGCIFYLAVFVALGGSQHSSAFTPEQLQALALMFLELNGLAFRVGMILFGFYCLLIGHLIFRSNFLPRILGVLVALAGMGHLVNTFASLLSPAFARLLLPYIMLPGFVGELSLMLWLLVMGVNATRWKERVTAAMEAVS